MIRRLILLSLAVYAIVALGRASSKRATEGQNDSQAHADWEAEGGSPRSESKEESLPA
jgi:hypothetical protein